MKIFGQFLFVPVCHNCNASVRVCNPGCSSPRAAADRGFLAVTNPVFFIPLPAERVGKTGGTGGSAEGKKKNKRKNVNDFFFSTARQDMRTDAPDPLDFTR